MYSTKINDIVQIQHSKCEMIITLEKSFKDYLILNEPRLINLIFVYMEKGF